LPHFCDFALESFRPELRAEGGDLEACAGLVSDHANESLARLGEGQHLVDTSVYALKGVFFVPHCIHSSGKR